MYSDNEITAKQLNEKWYGLYTPVKYNNKGATEFTIQLNATTITADATDVSLFIQAIFAHELGHAAFLSDNPPVSQPSIMIYKSGSMWQSITRPTGYDVRTVLAKNN